MKTWSSAPSNDLHPCRVLADGLPQHVLNFLSSIPQEEVPHHIASLARHHQNVTL